MVLFLQTLLALVQFFVGAALFSFLNVVAWRLPRGLPLVKDRSRCPACGATLSAADLVPILSWLALRGRCRYCGAKIAPRYLLTEALGGLLALLCAWRFGGLGAGPFGFSWQAFLTLLFLGVLFALALIDAETQTLPDGLVLCAALCGAAAFVVFPEPGWQSRLVGAVCVSGPMFLLCLVIPGGFGGGDIKLMAAAGLFLGWKLTLFAAFCAILTGGAYGAWLLAAKKADKKDHFAFGPFLCAGIAFSLFLGQPAIAAYLSLFGL